MLNASIPLTRLIRSRTSRRTAVGLAATGLLSLAVPDAEAARCNQQTLCPVCRRCRRHRCKPDRTQDGDLCGFGYVCDNGLCSFPSVASGHWSRAYQ